VGLVGVMTNSDGGEFYPGNASRVAKEYLVAHFQLSSARREIDLPYFGLA